MHRYITSPSPVSLTCRSLCLSCFTRPPQSPSLRFVYSAETVTSTRRRMGTAFCVTRRCVDRDGECLGQHICRRSFHVFVKKDSVTSLCSLWHSCRIGIRLTIFLEMGTIAVARMSERLRQRACSEPHAPVDINMQKKRRRLVPQKRIPGPDTRNPVGRQASSSRWVPQTSHGKVAEP